MAVLAPGGGAWRCGAPRNFLCGRIVSLPLPQPHLARYRSPVIAVSALARRWPTLVFHWRIVRLGRRTGRKIRGGVLSDADWLEFCQGMIRVFEEVGVRFDLDGAPVVSQLREPCVFVGNHLSLYDSLLLPVLVEPFGRATGVAAEYLRHLPVMGPVFRARPLIWVSAKRPRADLLKVYDEGVRHLRAGTSVALFPQGSRHAVFTPRGFNSLGVKLAARADVPLVTFALQTDAWPPGPVIRNLSRVHPGRTIRIAFEIVPGRIAGKGFAERALSIRSIVRQLDAWDLPVDRAARKPHWLDLPPKREADVGSENVYAPSVSEPT